MSNPLRNGLERYLSPKELALLRSVPIGIAGLGGLGSNVCMMLARTGIENFFLLDFDRVDASNLNRQCYFPSDLGCYKVDALQRALLQLNPAIHLECCYDKITEDNVTSLFPNCPIWVEAFDSAIDKALFVEKALLAKRFVVSASGIAGFGGPPLSQKTIGTLVLVGDFTSDIAKSPPLAPRVIWAAAMMSDAVLTHLFSARSFDSFRHR